MESKCAADMVIFGTQLFVYFLVLHQQQLTTLNKTHSGPEDFK